MKKTQKSVSANILRKFSTPMNAKGTECCRSQLVKLAPNENSTGPTVKRTKPRKLGSRKSRAGRKSLWTPACFMSLLLRRDATVVLGTQIRTLTQVFLDP